MQGSGIDILHACTHTRTHTRTFRVRLPLPALPGWPPSRTCLSLQPAAWHPTALEAPTCQGPQATLPLVPPPHSCPPISLHPPPHPGAWVLRQKRVMLVGETQPVAGEVSLLGVLPLGRNEPQSCLSPQLASAPVRCGNASLTGSLSPHPGVARPGVSAQDLRRGMCGGSEGSALCPQAAGGCGAQSSSAPLPPSPAWELLWHQGGSWRWVGAGKGRDRGRRSRPVQPTSPHSWHQPRPRRCRQTEGQRSPAPGNSQDPVGSWIRH